METGRDDQLKFAKHFERAQGWLLLENHAAADRALRAIPAAFRERSEVVQFRAQLHLAAGRWARAVPLLRRLVKQDPSEPQYWVSLAFAVRRALSIAQGDWTTLVSTPVSATLLTISAVFLIVPMLMRLWGRGRVLAQVAGDAD